MLRICMLAYTFYEADNRVRRYAEALANRGDQVDVVALRRGDQGRFGVLNGVNVYRIQRRRVDERRRIDYLLKTVRFFFASAWFVTRPRRFRQYDVIHVHSVPDFEVFAAALPRVAGSKMILDIHDIVPEFYMSKFSAGKRSLLYRALRTVERLSCGFVHHVIIANDLWREKLVARSVAPEKCSVFLNYPDSAFFKPRGPRPAGDPFLMIYPGTLNRHQGLDIAVRAVASIKEQVPGARFHIYGDGPELSALRALAAELDVTNRVIFKGLRSIEEIAPVMAASDLAVVPKRDGSFGGEAFSTKILEFMCLGVPVLAAGTKIDRYYFNEDVIRFFRPGDVEDCARGMVELAGDEAERRRLAHNAVVLAQDYTWDVHRQRYLDLVDRLAGRRRTRRPEPCLQSVC